MGKGFGLHLSLCVFVTGFALLGAFTTLDNGERSAIVGATRGAIFCAVFGLAVGGSLPKKWAPALLGSDAQGEKDGGRE
jgi:hypothetical protein